MPALIPLLSLTTENKFSTTLSVEETSTMGQESYYFKLSTPNDTVKACLEALGIDYKIDEGSLVWFYRGEHHKKDEKIKQNMNIIILNVIEWMKEAKFSIVSVSVVGSLYLSQELRKALTCKRFLERECAEIEPILKIELEKA